MEYNLFASLLASFMDDGDSPIFSPDEESIILSGNVPGESYQPNWLERFRRVRVAKVNGELSRFVVSAHKWGRN